MRPLFSWFAAGVMVTQTLGVIGDDARDTRSHCLFSTLTPDAVVNSNGVKCNDIAAYCWSTLYGDSVRAACPQTCQACVMVLQEPGVQIEVGGIAFDLLSATSEYEAPANSADSSSNPGANSGAATADANGVLETVGNIPNGGSTLAFVCLVTGAVVLIAVFGLVSWHVKSKKDDLRIVQGRMAKELNQSSSDGFEWDGILEDFLTVNTRRSKLNGGARTSGLTEHYPPNAYRDRGRKLAGTHVQSSDIDLLAARTMQRRYATGRVHSKQQLYPELPLQHRMRTLPPVPHQYRQPQYHEPTPRHLQHQYQEQYQQQPFLENHQQPPRIASGYRATPLEVAPVQSAQPAKPVQAIVGQGGRKDGLVSGGGRQYPAQQTQSIEPTYELAISVPPMMAGYELCGSHVGSTSDSVAETLRSTESHGYDLCGTAAPETIIEDGSIAPSSMAYQNRDHGALSVNWDDDVDDADADAGELPTQDDDGYEMHGSQIAAAAAARKVSLLGRIESA